MRGKLRDVGTSDILELASLSIFTSFIAAFTYSYLHSKLIQHIAVHLSYTSHRTVIDTEHLFGASDRGTIVVRHIFQGEE